MNYTEIKRKYCARVIARGLCDEAILYLRPAQYKIALDPIAMGIAMMNNYIFKALLSVAIKHASLNASV